MILSSVMDVYSYHLGMDVLTGVDLGGTKIEAVVLGPGDEVLARHRCPTPTNGYPATINAVAKLVHMVEDDAGVAAPHVGIGGPGSPSPTTGRQRNANSTILNGQPLACDLATAIGRPVTLANDADCLALSEAHDGAAAGHQCVFAVILGTGIGGGLVINGRLHTGPNALGGEFGHTALPRPRADETPGPACWCGQRGCLESWISGPALEAQWVALKHTALRATDIAASPHADAQKLIDQWLDRLARALANTITVLDPDVIVFGGGLNAMANLTGALDQRLGDLVFGGEYLTPLVVARHGDSSGVLGAARLPGPTSPTAPP